MQRDSLKKRALKTIWRIFLVLLGSSISATGISFFLRPHHLLSGGVTGTSLLISYLSGIDPGIFIILINIPLFIIAWKKIDLNFCLYSILGTISLSAFIMFFNTVPVGTISSSPLLACLYGGLLSGSGTGIVIRARASQGGTDIISVIVRRKFSVSIGTVSFYMNIVLVLLLSIIYNIELGLLTIFSQFIGAKALDNVVTGINSAKAITIVSDKADDIAKYIMERMDRGVTFLEGEGAFGKRQKRVIWCVVTTSQLSRVKNAMRKIDPDAFMVISNASEIVGHGFYQSPF